MPLRSTLRAALLLLVPFVPRPAPAAPRQTLFTTTHQAMGATWQLLLYAPSAARAAQVSQSVFEEVDRLDALLSNYRTDSELSRINRLAATEPVTTDPETFHFLLAAQHWSQVSGGSFDITVGPLMRAWGFFQHSGHVPTPAALAQLRPVVGFQHVHLDPATRTVRFDTRGVELDPGGIGKGFAVDSAVAILHDWHVSAALLSAGTSTLYAVGAPPSLPGWRVRITGPAPATTLLSTLFLRDSSLSSADCTRKHFTQAGVLYCHIMDPLTLAPVTASIQVAVTHPSATASDALSNVLFVLSPSRAFAVLATAAPHSQAFLLTRASTGQPVCLTARWPARTSIPCTQHPEPPTP